MRMQNMEIIVTDARFCTDEIKQRFAAEGLGLVLRPYQTGIEPPKDVYNARAIITTSARFPASVVQNLHKCEIIVRCGVGVDNIDLAAATKKGIYVANTPGFYVEEVSTHALGLLLSLSRKIAFTDNLLRTGQYRFSEIQPLHGLRGKILGIIGFGLVGRAILDKTKALGLSYLVYDPYQNRLSTPSTVKMVDLGYLIENSDFISINCPLTSETNALLGENEFRRMKASAILINTARGEIINENALLKALELGWISGAGLDVLIEEPPRPDHPLLHFQNVIVTPHIAWYSEEAIQKMALAATEEVLRVFAGELPHSLVNEDIHPGRSLSRRSDP